MSTWELAHTRVRSILRSMGHGPSLDDGRIADEYVYWDVALTNSTDSMRHERDMVQVMLNRRVSSHTRG